jgi:hypothetical protein
MGLLEEKRWQCITENGRNEAKALHREIARRIRRNPELLTEVREGLVKDIRSGRFSGSAQETEIYVR